MSAWQVGALHPPSPAGPDGDVTDGKSPRKSPRCRHAEDRTDHELIKVLPRSSEPCLPVVPVALLQITGKLAPKLVAGANQTIFGAAT